MKVFLRFDGPPGPVSPRFIEAENLRGESISVGKWFKELPRSRSADWFLVLEVEDKKPPKTFFEAQKGISEHFSKPRKD